MIRGDTFVSSVLFAALAAAGWVPWAIFAVPIAGPRSAYAAYLIAVTALYVAAILPHRTGGRRALSRLGTLIITGTAGVALAILTRTNIELAVGLAALLGLARSGFLYRTEPARAVATELILLCGGLCLARFLIHFPSPMPAVWGFLLVQSLFFLVPGRAPRRVNTQRDPFEAAHRQALELLDRASV